MSLGVVSLNNATTQNQFAAAATLNCEGSDRQTIIVTNAAVIARVTLRTGPTRVTGASGELFFPPGYYDRTFLLDRIEFKSAAPGAPAQVTIHAE